MKTLSQILVILLFVSCAPVRVNYDYERGVDFSKYKTYNYYQDLNTGLSELDTNRLLDVLDAGLQAKGFTLSETPDFFVNIVSDEYQEAQRNSVGVGMGGTGRNVGGGISIGIPLGQGTMNRQIIFDFVDENGKGLFWQAVSESSYNPNATPEQREAKLKAIVNKVLSGYPPKK
ncbi:uncharacterized protein DUF4136 [Flavobacteriaceae bacterium MAR_2010_72]|nr:uncharacterized protein DUF4136 [Flavobacteriaceae bacterium MAR_2010_72]